MEIDAKAARIARRQYGLLTRAQAITIGFSDKAIRTRLARGSWAEIRRGVYVVGGVPPSWEQTICAVTLPFDDCWISHATAGRVWHLPHSPDVDRIETLRPYGKRRDVTGVLDHRSRIITPADVSNYKGMRVTSRGRTIVECSGRLSAKQTGRMIDVAMRQTNNRALEETRAAYARLAGGGHRRFASVRAALAKRIPGYDPGESDLELVALAAIIAAGLPIPVQQHRVTIHGKRYRIDLAYPALMIAIELVGWTWHGGRASFDDDKARSADLVSIGWRVIEITTEHAVADFIRWISDTLEVAAAA